MGPMLGIFERVARGARARSRENAPTRVWRTKTRGTRAWSPMSFTRACPAARRYAGRTTLWMIDSPP